jgi:hypothetical protein
MQRRHILIAHRMIKLPIIAALVTVLSYHLHALTSATSEGGATAVPPPTPDAMSEYMRILRTLGALAMLSGETEMQRGRELGMMLYTKVETLLRARRLQGGVGKGKLAVTEAGSFIDFRQIDPINQEGFAAVENCIRSGP